MISFGPTKHQGQAPITPDEFVEVEIAAKMNNLVADALRKRGLDISDRNLVCVDPWSAGYFGDDEDPTNRVARATFYLRKEADDMQYAHPIEGLTALVDLYRKEVIKIEDAGVTPVPQTQRNYDRRFIKKYRDDIKPLQITQPEGPSFKVNGWEVTWQRWRLRVAFTPREGLVLNDIRYNDVEKGKERPIIYRAAVVEMTVPYGDTIATQSRKNAFDIGEYGVGVNTNSLTLGCDCLGEIHYFDFDFVNTAGEIESIPNAVCMHEEDDSILWKHTELRTNKVEVRRSRKLIISCIATVGNYEYGFYWVLRQDGSIELEVKAIGLVQTAALPPGESPKFGVMMEEGCYAPNHQHFFCARLDMNLDGPSNQVVEVNTDHRSNGAGQSARQCLLREAYTFQNRARSASQASLRDGAYLGRAESQLEESHGHERRLQALADGARGAILAAAIGRRETRWLSRLSPLGHTLRSRGELSGRASIRTRTPAPMACRCGRRKIAASSTRKSLFGTTSAITTFRGSKTGR